MTSLDFFFKTGSLLLLCQRPLFAGSRGCSSIPCVDFSLRGSSCCKARVLGHPGFQQLQSMSWVVVATGLTCSATCGIFRDRGSNPCPLLWYVGSYPLCHQASPSFDFLNPVISEPAAHSWFQVCVCVCVCACVHALSRVWLCDPLDYQAPLSVEFSRQEYWSGLPFPPPGDLPNREMDPALPASAALQADSWPTEPSG